MTEDKLTFLAKKEEELRKLNEQLTEKQKMIESPSQPDPNEDQELSASDPENSNPDSDNEKQAEMLENELKNEKLDENEEIKESKKADQAENQEKPNEQPTEEDAEFEKNLLEVKKYQEVVEKCTEYERTIALQKAKIETLELELQNSISNLNAKDLQINELESKDKNLSEVSKKYMTQINQLNVSMQKLKQQNTEYFSKIEGLEKSVALLRQEVNKNSQAKEKVTQESHGKDLKYF